MHKYNISIYHATEIDKRIITGLTLPTLPAGWMPVVKQTPSAEATARAHCARIIGLQQKTETNKKEQTSSTL